MLSCELLRNEDMVYYLRFAVDSCDLNYDKFVVNGKVHNMAYKFYTSHILTVWMQKAYLRKS